MAVLGVDAAGRHGWVSVVLDDEGSFAGAHVHLTVVAAIAAAERQLGTPLAVIAVDIPIGLVAGPSRAADRAARTYVGPRRASVFPAPHPEVVHFDDYAEVNRRLVSLGLPRQSRQGFGLFARIREVAALATDARIVEAFPEASFTALGGQHVAASKKTWNGARQRHRLLAAARPPILLPDDLGPAGSVPLDDVLDAAACAWTARRVADGTAEHLGDPAERDAVTGREIVVRC